MGDGVLRKKHESAARASALNVLFHGRVAHERVPLYIAAADLCLAPYDPTAFSNGEFGYSTMKVPEYLSAGRAVVTVPSGRLPNLVRHGQTGFLVANRVEGDAPAEGLPEPGKTAGDGRGRGQGRADELG